MYRIKVISKKISRYAFYFILVIFVTELEMYLIAIMHLQCNKGKQNYQHGPEYKVKNG